MKILALELSTAQGSLAWRDGDCDVAWEWANDRKNSGEFFRNVAGAQQRFGPPQRIVVGLGPGSYAGTRIAISTAIGLQLATGAELAGFSSLCAIDAPEYAVVGDARRQSFFLAQVRDNVLLGSPALHDERSLRDLLEGLRGRMPIFAAEPLPQFDGVVVRYPSAQILARLAAKPNCTFVLPPLEPMYLREPHITTPKSK